MCTNYAAARRDQLFKHFGVEPPENPWREEVYKDYPTSGRRGARGRGDVRHRVAQAHAAWRARVRHDERAGGDRG